MKVVLLTGSHPRHLFLAHTLHRAGLLGGLLIENRGVFVPQPPQHLQPVDRDNFVRHFHDRDEAENKFFGGIDYRSFGVPLFEVEKKELNNSKTKEWIRQQEADVIITYGVHKISDEMLENFPVHSWNVHGGLSPWFRGNITLFWPFYFLKPNWAGMTIHQLTAKLDGGGIVHHSVPRLDYGDGVHDVACKAVIQVGEDLVSILEALSDGAEVRPVRQKSNGKLFVSNDWHPQHLRLIYQTFDNDIVDRYLEGELPHQAPPLVDFFTEVKS